MTDAQSRTAEDYGTVARRLLTERGLYAAFLRRWYGPLALYAALLEEDLERLRAATTPTPPASQGRG